jgi:hypothetical protein
MLHSGGGPFAKKCGARGQDQCNGSQVHHGKPGSPREARFTTGGWGSWLADRHWRGDPLSISGAGAALMMQISAIRF